MDKARAATCGIDLDLVACDLASLESVRACADALNRDGRPFDVVIANAGVMAVPEKRLTRDGFEMQFGTNHLGHFVLVNRIAGLIRDGGRFISLSSAGHRFADVDLDDPNFDHTPYTPFGAYGRSKTANALFAVEFDRRHRGRGVRAAAVHPGGIQAELDRHMDPAEIAGMIETINASQPEGTPPFQWKTIPQGAATSVWAGFVGDADAIGGRYCEDCHVAPVTEGEGIRGGVQAYAIGPDHARALWAKSEAMVGEIF